MENVQVNTQQPNTVTEVTTSDETLKPSIHLDGLEQYKDIVAQLREKLINVVQEGYMTEVVASRIIDEFSYTAFNQTVKVNYS